MTQLAERPGRMTHRNFRKTQETGSSIYHVEHPERTALVMSGGGAKGAFSVGVVADLYDRFRDDGWFSIVGGASTGAIVAPMAALLAAEPSIAEPALETLIRSYTTMTTSDVLDRRRWIDLIKHRDSLHQSSPLKVLLHERFLPEWFDWLQTPEAPDCYVLYTNFRSGQKVAASPRDAGMNRDRFIEAIIASASVPGLINPTVIDGDACFDGCLRDLVPVDRAIELGATTLVPIVLDPEMIKEQRGGVDRFDKILSRAFSILVDEVGRSDLEIARNISKRVQMRDTLEQIDRELAATWQTKRIRNVRQAIHNLAASGSEGSARRVIEGLRPRYQLSEEWLDFEPENMKAWLAHGREVSQAVVKTSPF